MFVAEVKTSVIIIIIIIIIIINTRRPNTNPFAWLSKKIWFFKVLTLHENAEIWCFKIPPTPLRNRSVPSHWPHNL